MGGNIRCASVLSAKNIVLMALLKVKLNVNFGTQKSVTVVFVNVWNFGKRLWSVDHEKKILF